MNIRISDIELKENEQLIIHYKDAKARFIVDNENFLILYLINKSGFHQPVTLQDGIWTILPKNVEVD